MRFEWVDNGRGYVARVGDWRLETWQSSDGAHRATVCLDDAEVLDAQYTRFATLDEAKAAAERWVREYVAPFVEAERAACAEIADRAERRHTEALSDHLPEYAAYRECDRRDEAREIAQAIRARRDGAK